MVCVYSKSSTLTTFLCCCGRGASAEAHPCHVFTFKYFERATLRGGYFPAGRIRTSYRTYTSVGASPRGTSRQSVALAPRGGCTALPLCGFRSTARRTLNCAPQSAACCPSSVTSDLSCSSHHDHTLTQYDHDHTLTHLQFTIPTVLASAAKRCGFNPAAPAPSPPRSSAAHVHFVR